MIPFVYSLRKEIQIQAVGGYSFVFSETPFVILKVAPKAETILRLCDGKRTVNDIAQATETLGEEEVYRICDHFNKRGILEIQPAPSNGYTPYVSVIIPTRDRKDELRECLESVYSQDYPKDRLEVIVIDDGSKDGTFSLAADFPCAFISNPVSRGQSFCRNRGAERARGEILAFLDSDCVASHSWLRELTSPFQWKAAAAVGGYVDGYYEESSLDRYEKSFSSLNMGKHILAKGKDASTLYAPTCNLLVRKSAYLEVEGIKEDMRLGEDVDLCWRLRAKDYTFIYLPCGAVKHKHRSILPQMLKRRAQYGTSESLLYRSHPDKKKTLALPPLATISFLSLCAALFLLSPLPLSVGVASFLVEGVLKRRRIRRLPVRIRSTKILFSLARTYLSLFYFLSFHVLRYYALLLLLAGVFFRPFLLLFIWVLLFSSVVDYFVKRPRLSYPRFLFYYTLEHFAYQIGVFVGCLRKRTFGSYRIVFQRRFL